MVLGLCELCIFLYLTNKTLKDSDNIVYNILFCYLCQILNYKLIGGLAWISIGVSLYPSDCTILLMIFIWVVKGMRIKKRAYISIHSEEYVGVCNKNSIKGTWADSSLSTRERIKKKESPKGAPCREWFHFMKKNFGLKEAVKYSVSPYVRIMLGK